MSTSHAGITAAAPPTTIEELTQDIPIHALVKRTLHELKRATRTDIADHLGLHKDDRNHISKALNYLDRNREIKRIPGDDRPAYWEVATKGTHQAPTSNHQPASTKDAAKRPPKPTTTTSKPVKARASKPTPTATKAATKRPDTVTDIHQPSTSKPTNPDHRTARDFLIEIKAGAILSDIKQRLDQLDHLMATPPQHIREREEKSRLLEILAGQMNDEIGAKLLEINRDLLTADGRIPPPYTDTAA